jgi:hypothetical protein
VSDDLDAELIQDEEPERSYYVDKIDMPELRRYVALDMARMIGPLPDKTLKLAREIEQFLLGRGVRGAVE